MLKSLVANNFLNIYIFMNSDEIIAALKKMVVALSCKETNLWCVLHNFIMHKQLPCIYASPCHYLFLN
jgi:hypothetical protein